MLKLAQTYMILEGEMNIRSDNPDTINTYYIRPFWKESHLQRDGMDNGSHRWFYKYTPLNISKERIYQEYANTAFWKGGIRPLFPIKESSQTNKLKYFHFHKGHNHNIVNYI